MRALISSHPELASFAALIERNGDGLDSVLRHAKGSPVTLFAPSDAALEAAPSHLRDRLQVDDWFLQEFAHRHLAYGQWNSERLQEFGTLMTVLGPQETAAAPDTAGAERDPGFGGAGFAEADIAVAEGVVHIIDRVPERPDWVPWTYSLPNNMFEALRADGRFSVFSSKLAEGGIERAYRNDPNLTLLAIGDASLTGTEFVAPDDVSTGLEPFVMLHRIEAGVIQDGDLIEDMYHRRYQVRVEGEQIQVGGATLGERIRTPNGDIRVVDRAPAPLGNVAFPFAAARASGQFQRFFDMLDREPLEGHFQEGFAGTLFLPTDAAFDAYSDAELHAMVGTPSLLRGLVVRSISERRWRAADLQTDMRVYPAGYTGAYPIEARDGDRLISGHRISVTDIGAGPSIVHGIDGLLLPRPTFYENSLYRQLQEAGRFSRFLALAEGTRVANLLRVKPTWGERPFSVFAPEDEAFDAITGQIEWLELDRERRERVLLAHLVADTRPLEELAGEQLTAEQGESAIVEIGETETTFNGIVIGSTEPLIADNGLIYSLDEVLLAPDEHAPNSFTNSLRRVLEADGRFTWFLDLALQYDLLGTLAFQDGLTLLLPTDERVGNRIADIREAVDNDAEFLSRLVQFPIVPQRLSLAELGRASELPSLETCPIAVETTALGTTVDGAEILEADLQADNGVIHVIERLLVMPDLAELLGPAGNSGSDTDRDADGLADDWERRHLGGLDHGPEGDADGDRYTNAEEARLGTDPGDAASALQLVLAMDGDRPHLSWSCLADCEYILTRIPDLQHPEVEGPTTRIRPEQGQQRIEYVDTLATPDRQCFYRLTVVEPSTP